MKRLATAIAWWLHAGIGWEAVALLGFLGAVAIFQ
jgi:hypothetical protein